MEITKIDKTQYFFIIPNLLFGKAIGITAGVMVRKLGSDTWISMIFGFIIGIIISFLTIYLCSKFPNKNILEFSEQILGKWLGKLLGIILAIYFILAFGASANVMLLHLKEYFLPETPYWLLCVLYTLLCTYGVFLGFEVIIRFSLVSFIMLILITLTMVTGTITDLKLANLQPLMDKGFITDLLGSMYIFSDISMVILIIGFVYPILNKKESVYKTTFWSILTGAVMVIVWPIFETMVMGPEVMKQYVVVCMQQIRCAQLTKYLPRYELVMVSFFTFSIFIQAALMFFCAKQCIKIIAPIKKDWVIILPLTLILILVTYFMASDHNRYIDFLAFPYSQMCAILSISIPFLLYFIALFRGKLKPITSSGPESD